MLYIDSSFFSEFHSPVSGSVALPMSYTRVTSLSGIEEFDIIYTAGTPLPSILDIDQEFSAAPTVTSGYLDNYNEYNTGSAKTPYYTYFPVDAVFGLEDGPEWAEDIATSYFVENKIEVYYGILANYTTGSGSSSTIDQTIDYTTTSGIFSTRDAYCDATMNGWVFRPFPFCATCGIATRSGTWPFEIETISGSVLAQKFYSHCGIQQIDLINFVSFCGNVEIPNFNTNLSVVDGFIDHMNYEVYCGVSASASVNFDVWLLSLKIENFKPDADSYISTSGTVCVDIVDDVYGVVTSGTYFLFNNTQISGTFTAITNGYRMCYDAVDDFTSIYSPIEIKVHAENTNGDWLEQSFYLTSGYLVEYKNANYLGFNKRIYVRLSAENQASCPSLGAVGYWFETADAIPKDLSADIIGTRDIEQTDLTASIYPNSTAYFYGKIFKVELRVKDHAGNEMRPYVFEFRIEDKPEEN